MDMYKLLKSPYITGTTSYIGIFPAFLHFSSTQNKHKIYKFKTKIKIIYYIYMQVIWGTFSYYTLLYSSGF